MSHKHEKPGNAEVRPKFCNNLTDSIGIHYTSKCHYKQKQHLFAQNACSVYYVLLHSNDAQQKLQTQHLSATL